MSDGPTPLIGPDLTQGIPLAEIGDGAMLLGHAHGEPILLARRGDALWAIGAVCSHYGGPLAEGLLVGDSVRCPWHHACFDLRTGAALRAPALKPVACWRVERQNGAVYVGHAETWDASEIDGRPQDRDCKVTLRRGTRALAVVTISRDLESLRAELELEAMVEHQPGGA